MAHHLMKEMPTLRMVEVLAGIACDHTVALLGRGGTHDVRSCAMMPTIVRH